jgi:hypothetical protein
MSLWCRKLDCINNEGQMYEDGNGPQGCCSLEENQINRDGKCEDKNDRI